METERPRVRATINDRQFVEAAERERAALVVLPPFDLEEWLSRKPRHPGSDLDRSKQQDIEDAYFHAYSNWLYSSPLPIEMTFWNILVEPRPPKQMSVGGILLPEEVKQAENFKTNIGRIVHMGDGAYRSRTDGGIDLTRLRCPQVGDYIVHRHYSGLEMIMQDTGRRLRIMDDTDVIGFIKNPDEWRMYL